MRTRPGIFEAEATSVVHLKTVVTDMLVKVSRQVQFQTFKFKASCIRNKQKQYGDQIWQVDAI